MTFFTEIKIFPHFFKGFPTRDDFHMVFYGTYAPRLSVAIVYLQCCTLHVSCFAVYHAKGTFVTPFMVLQCADHFGTGKNVCAIQ